MSQRQIARELGIHNSTVSCELRRNATPDGYDPAQAQVLCDDRMPLVLDDDSMDAWLDPDLVERDAIRAGVRHLEADAFTAWPVSTRVNRVANDDPSLVEPVSV